MPLLQEFEKLSEELRILGYNGDFFYFYHPELPSHIRVNQELRFGEDGSIHVARDLSGRGPPEEFEAKYKISSAGIRFSIRDNVYFLLLYDDRKLEGEVPREIYRSISEIAEKLGYMLNLDVDE